WKYLREVGISEVDLNWFRDNPCRPDIIGCNYYVTSERYLDERAETYPAWSHGGNARHRYADVEAIRARARGVSGVQVLLREAWNRYGLPVAITECHLGGPREAQIAWLAETWQNCQELRETAVDVRAVTVWSLLGAYD